MAVSDVQTTLKALGFDPGAIDNAMGPGTAAAIMAFQAARGLGVTGDADAATLAALAAAVPAAAVRTDPTPAWLATMQSIEGKTAARDNVAIVGWAQQISRRYPDMAAYCAGYTNDMIPWCGLTVAFCLAVNGIRPVFGANDYQRFLWADAWKGFGAPAPTPRRGDILVFYFSAADQHVTLLEYEENGEYWCHGGNQSRAVKLSAYPKNALRGVRRPA